MNIFLFIIIGLLVFFIYSKIVKKFKFPNVGALALFTGGVKSGKSATSLACALSCYRKVRRRWKFRKFFVRFFNLFRSSKRKRPLPEEPFFYSTIPVKSVPYVQITSEHLLREKRFHYKSVVFIDEASLVADSQLVQNKKINSQLLLFFKLFGHETRGGKCIVNTHCITDLHYALKRTTSQYFYVNKVSKYIPFFTISYMREERYSEDGSTVNAYTEDVQDSLKRCIMRSSVFKKYDTFCFSEFTDDLPTDTEDDVILLRRKDSLKAVNIVSFRPEFFNLSKKNSLDVVLLDGSSEEEVVLSEKESC